MSLGSFVVGSGFSILEDFALEELVVGFLSFGSMRRALRMKSKGLLKEFEGFIDLAAVRRKVG